MRAGRKRGRVRVSIGGAAVLARIASAGDVIRAPGALYGGSANGNGPPTPVGSSFAER